jgi:hypothetical protein
LIGKPEVKRPLGKLTCSWEDNIMIDHIAWGDVDRIDLAQKRDKWRALLNMVVNLLVSYNVGEFLSSCITGGISKRAQLHGVSFTWTVINEISNIMSCIQKVRVISHAVITIVTVYAKKHILQEMGIHFANN